MFIFQLFSKITPPTTNIPDAGTPTDNLIMVLNFLLKVIFIVAGIWSLFNFVSAGFRMIGSSGDPKVLEKVQNQFVWTIIGIAVMIASVVVAGIIGILVYDDWGAILNPTFETP